MFKSIYGSDRTLSPSQYLAELIIKRRADKQSVVLPNLFWKDKTSRYTYWHLAIERENRFAASMLKKAGIKHVLNVFNSKEGERFLSFSNPKFHDLVEREKQRDKLEQSIKIHNITNLTNPNIRPRGSKNNKSNRKGTLDQLRDE